VHEPEPLVGEPPARLLDVAHDELERGIERQVLGDRGGRGVLELAGVVVRDVDLRIRLRVAREGVAHEEARGPAAGLEGLGDEPGRAAAIAPDLGRRHVRWSRTYGLPQCVQAVVVHASAAVRDDPPGDLPEPLDLSQVELLGGAADVVARAQLLELAVQVRDLRGRSLPLALELRERALRRALLRGGGALRRPQLPDRPLRAPHRGPAVPRKRWSVTKLRLSSTWWLNVFAGS
jgi:hypothetical protein